MRKKQRLVGPIRRCAIAAVKHEIALRAQHWLEACFARSMLRCVLPAALLAWLALGCSSSLPMPPEVQHPARAYIEVPYPPPAALVEEVPQPAPPDTVWVDGHWLWRGRYYVWQRGGWVTPPENASYATWRSMLAKDGRLLFAPGAWYDASSQDMTPPQVVSKALTPPSQSTPETEAPR